MASDSSAKERAEARRLRVSFDSERRILSTARGTPITPVEQTMISLAVQPSRLAVSATVFCVAAWPAGPVAQFALPAFTITARMRPFDARKCPLEIVTGAATTRFWVKTAAAEAGTSLVIIARSSAPVFFSPQAMPAKRNPRGREASESACLINGISAGLTGRSRKQPAVLRDGGE